MNTVITGVADRYDPSKRIAAGFFGMEPQVSESVADRSSCSKTCGG